MAILLFIIINFYIFSSIVNLNSFFYSFLQLSVLTDGLYVLSHLTRRRIKHKNLLFDPTKLTVVVACYNGEDIIAETISQALVHVPANQIIVVSDASTDKTVEVAQGMGVQVIQNHRNLNKPFSISIAMRLVKTPYVLILDDDTLIGDTFIPTSLLDDGYSAVAFNVMPVPDKTLINELQQFEYRQSMQLGKSSRASVGAIGNVSGAIGLYHTKDLINQVTRHSGQFGGEDEQRTMLVHIFGSGKGVTYTDSTVLTKPPSTYLQLYRQRAYKWNASVPELFVLYWRILLSPRYHPLLKAEKGYLLYIFLTDPLRMLFFITLFVRSSHLLIVYGFYLFISTLVWLRLGSKDSVRSVILYPLYTLALTTCRFISHFYWLKIKGQYFLKRFHRYVEHRKLIWEYSTVMIVIVFVWGISSFHFNRDLRLFNQIQEHRLEEVSKVFNYDNVTSYGTVSTEKAAMVSPEADFLLVPVERGDTQRAIAYKAITQYLAQQGNLTALQEDHSVAYIWLTGKLQSFDSSQPGLAIHVDKSDIVKALDYEKGKS